MDFELTAEQLQVKFSEREFANRDRTARPGVDETQHFPVELLPHLAQLGLMGVIFQYHGEPETQCRMFADFTS